MKELYTFTIKANEVRHFLELQKNGSFKILSLFTDRVYLKKEYGLHSPTYDKDTYIINLKNNLVPMSIYSYNKNKEVCPKICIPVKKGKFSLDFFFQESTKYSLVPKDLTANDDIIGKIVYWKKGVFFKCYLTLKISMLNKFLKKIKRIKDNEILQKKFHFEEFHYIVKHKYEKSDLIQVN